MKSGTVDGPDVFYPSREHEGDAERSARQRVMAFLDHHGLTQDHVLAELDLSFGKPLLVIATGSVVVGLGNARSDLDLHVVVEDPVSSSLPLMSYLQGARVDVTMFGAHQLVQRRAGLAGRTWPPPDTGPGDLVARRRVLDGLSRFTLGSPLAGNAQWIDWWQGLGQGLAGWLQDWWAVEAVRKRIAARQLRELKPMVAALRAGEAVLAALEHVAVGRGELYFKPKWLGEKLLRLADPAALEVFRAAITPPRSPRDVPSYLARMEDVLDEYLPAGGSTPVPDTTGWRVRLRHATGTSLHTFGPHRLASRWGMRTVAIPAGSPTSGDDAWDYALDEPWDDHVATMFAHDLLWLGLRRVS